MPSILLRYFDCRGRAQPIRYYLAHLGVPFTDERVSFKDGWHTWAQMKSDPALSGPFGKLPVLVWDGRLHAETLVISSLLQEALHPCDPSGKAPPIAQVQSALYEDLAALYELLNLDQISPGTDPRRVADRVQSQLSQSFRSYETLVAGSGSPFVSSERHTAAAFWLNEVWQLAQCLLGTRALALTDGLPGLGSLLDVVASLPAVAQPPEPVPAFWSARPDEPERLVALRKALAH